LDSPIEQYYLTMGSGSAPCDERLPERYRTLLDVASTIATHRDLGDLARDLTRLLPRVVPVNFISLGLYNPHRHTMKFQWLEANVPTSLVAGFEFPVEETISGHVWETQEPLLVRDLAQAAQWPRSRETVQKYGIQSSCTVPLTTAVRRLGAIGFASVQKAMYEEEDVEFLNHVGKLVAVAVDHALAHEENAQLREKLAKEKLYLEEEIKAEYNFEEIIGKSQALKRVLKDVHTVAATDSTVLILGETGSGKELVARALHNLSQRRERTFVKLNCAAIPTGLLESELFGHERGAFTGAIATKIGRFELAHQGTLFLDEVGDISMELQVKLLRVLQEQEFERLGSTKTLRVNVRVIAATNRDLEQMVQEQKFRSDLYYRLKVFPVTVPPLRDRSDDIPLLVRHFAQKYAQRMNKGIETIPSASMKALQNYGWPGNIRELENFVERAVILSSTSELFVPISELKRPTVSGQPPTTLEDAERQHILKTLRETRWVIGGPAGAAARLGMKRTSLQTKMEKLGITRPV
jgi:formate hydrogenlyase transcriptional activator